MRTATFDPETEPVAVALLLVLLVPLALRLVAVPLVREDGGALLVLDRTGGSLGTVPAPGTGSFWRTT